MDLTFGKKTQGTGVPSAATMMVTWPECLYKEKEPMIRFMLLDEADHQGLTPDENVIRRRLMESRYPTFKKNARSTEDHYLKLWLFMSFAADNIKREKLPRSAQKDILKLHKELGIGDLTGETEQNLLYRELYHMTILYINLSLEDKRYGSLIFGFGRLSDDKLAKKIARDAYKVGHRVPELLKFANYEIWEKAVRDAYCEFFPDNREYLRGLIEGTAEEN